MTQTSVAVAQRDSGHLWRRIIWVRFTNWRLSFRNTCSSCFASYIFINRHHRSLIQLLQKLSKPQYYDPENTTIQAKGAEQSTGRWKSQLRQSAACHLRGYTVAGIISPSPRIFRTNALHLSMPPNGIHSLIPTLFITIPVLN